MGCEFVKSSYMMKPVAQISTGWTESELGDLLWNKRCLGLVQGLGTGECLHALFKGQPPDTSRVQNHKFSV